MHLWKKSQKGALSPNMRRHKTWRLIRACAFCHDKNILGIGGQYLVLYESGPLSRQTLKGGLRVDNAVIYNPLYTELLFHTHFVWVLSRNVQNWNIKILYYRFKCVCKCVFVHIVATPSVENISNIHI